MSQIQHLSSLCGLKSELRNRTSRTGYRNEKNVCMSDSGHEGKEIMGKSEYYRRRYQTTHHRICPAKIFEKEPSSGLRSVILQAVDLLLKGDHVVIDDEHLSKESRSSYIRVINKKVPQCKFTLVKLAPQHGAQQLFWIREFRVASLVEKCAHQKIQVISSRKTDSRLKKWCSREDPENIVFDLDTDMCRDEGWDLIDRRTGLTVDVHYKLELPGLFIQWDCVAGDQGDLSAPLPTLAEVCTHWYGHHPCGRVLIIADGSNIKSGATSSAEEKARLTQSLTKLCQKVDLPVYAVHLERPSQTCSFSSPPRPGLIAYLQRRHSVDLTHKGTMYLFCTPSHKTMAEKAGIQHIKASKVFQTPALVKNNLVTIKCRSPDMLLDLTVREPLEPTLAGDRPDPQIPLLSEFVQDGLSDSHLSADIGSGRREYLFVRDRDVLNKYMKLYQENATPIGETGSKVARLCQMSTVAQQHRAAPSSPPPSTLRPTSSRMRKPPSWMLQTPNLLKSHISTSSEESGSTVKRSRLSQKTMYVMTEAELVDVASTILKEAGREIKPCETADVADGSPVMGDLTDHHQAEIPEVFDDQTEPDRNCEPDRDNIGYVPDTVSVVPETLILSGQTQRHYPRDRATPDLSVLDEIFS